MTHLVDLISFKITHTCIIYIILYICIFIYLCEYIPLSLYLYLYINEHLKNLEQEKWGHTGSIRIFRSRGRGGGTGGVRVALGHALVLPGDHFPDPLQAGGGALVPKPNPGPLEDLPLIL